MTHSRCEAIVYNIPFTIVLGAARSSMKNDVGHGEFTRGKADGDVGNW
jgi:hypothetical protein